jgi:hypothetical protein
MRPQSNRELQAKVNDVLQLEDDCLQKNKKSKRAVVSSDTDGKHLDPVKKRRRVVKAVKKEEEFGVKKADLEDCLKPPAAVKEEEKDETEVKEDSEDHFPSWIEMSRKKVSHLQLALLGLSFFPPPTPRAVLLHPYDW